MGYPADGSGLRVMHSVIVHMDWHSQNVERHVSGHDEEEAVLAITAIVKEIVDCSSLGPSTINLEVNRGERVHIFAFGHGDTLSELPIVDASVFEKRIDQ